MSAIIPWQPHDNEIYHMDALTLLRHMPDDSVDLILTDPPYGLGNRPSFIIDRSMGWADYKNKGDYAAVREEWDKEAPTSWFHEVNRILKPYGSVVCFGARQSIYEFASAGLSLGWRIVNDVTWVKPDAVPNFTGRMMCESTERFLWFCPDGKKWTYNKAVAWRDNHGKNFRDVWMYRIERVDRIHPTQKPIAMIKRIVELISNPGDLILDPFMGSGTTAVAARNINRRFIGCDISGEYVDLARKRLRDTDPYQSTALDNGQTQLSLFEQSA